MKEHREFERHALDLVVEVFELDKATAIEKTRMKNISGGGACFVSSRPEAYRPGQEILLEMHLPLSDGQEALMQGKATVAWVGDERESEAGGSQVGVSMIQLVSVGLQGSNPIV